MQILCASDQAFMAHTATMLASVGAHNKNVTAHWISSQITNREISQIQDFFRKLRLSVYFYPAPIETICQLPIDKHASVANYFRILAPDLLPISVERILYLDSDIIVRKNLDPLWQHNMGGAAVAAVQDPGGGLLAQKLGLQGENYFNSGVMLLNLLSWRKEKFGKRILEFISANPEKISYWDQDGINAVLEGRWSRLPVCWNVQHDFFFDPELRLAYSEEIRDPAIVHFSGQGLKPWQYGLRHPFKIEYRKYRKRTPWPRYRENSTPSIVQRAKAGVRRIAWLQAIGFFLRMRGWVGR